jgi:mono/diheme cytochrome c family protein
MRRRSVLRRQRYSGCRFNSISTKAYRGFPDIDHIVLDAGFSEIRLAGSQVKVHDGLPRTGYHYTDHCLNRLQFDIYQDRTSIGVAACPKVRNTGLPTGSCHCANNIGGHMQRSISRASLLGAALFSVSTIAMGQGQPDLGKFEYDSNCAVCHGTTGEGGGPYASQFMKTPPPDLTILAKTNGGVFPIQRVYETIDGRNEVAAHGPRHMPIWGADYSTKAAQRMSDIPQVDFPEAYARARILLLIDYLYRIQKK